MAERQRNSSSYVDGSDYSEMRRRLILGLVWRYESVRGGEIAI